MLQRAWRKALRLYRTKTDPVGFARSLGVIIGERCRFIDTSEETFGSEPYLIRIGDHVTITAGVKFITHDGGVWVFRDLEPGLDVVAPIIVGSNVFLGLNAMIMPGVTIGDNSVVGAGALVTRDIPPSSVAVGVPARAVKTIEEYRRSLGERGFDIRRLAPEEKRRFLEQRYARELAGS